MIASEYRFICVQQQWLYEYAQRQDADIRKFSNEFLSSRFCNTSLDKPYSVDQYADIVNWIELMADDCRIVPDPEQELPVPYSVAGWIGFMYRYVQIVTGSKSKDLARIIPIDRLIISYPGLHTVDEDMASDIIIHDFKIPVIPMSQRNYR